MDDIFEILCLEWQWPSTQQSNIMLGMAMAINTTITRCHIGIGGRHGIAEEEKRRGETLTFSLSLEGTILCRAADMTEHKLQPFTQLKLESQQQKLGMLYFGHQ